MRPALENALLKRNQALSQNEMKNNMRRYRLAGWLLDENRLLAHADVLLDKLSTKPQDEDAYYALLSAAHKIRFRVQPFNQLAYALKQTSNHIEDPTVIETTREGIQFQRLRNYLMQPFRVLTARPTAGSTKADTAQRIESAIPAVEERLAALEAVDIGEPYKRLIGRVLVEGNTVSSELHGLNITAAQKAANRVKQLLVYHCLPGETDDAMQRWYRYRLYG